METHRLRVVIIGAGIVGLAIGEALCRRGAAVTVVERNAIATGTTGNSFAWLNATSKTSNEAYHRLNAAGLAAWLARGRKFGENTIGLCRRGMIEWADGDDGDAAAALDRALAQLAAWNYPAHAVDFAELALLEPHFDFPQRARGLYAAADAALDAPQAAAHLAECIRAGGGEIFEDRAALGLTRNGETVATVETDAGPLSADRVVVAAGRESNRTLAALTGIEGFIDRGPVGAVPGALVQTPPADPFQYVRHVVYCEHFGPLHVQPAPGGGLLMGGDDTDDWIADGHDQALLDRIASHLLDRARRLIPGLPIDGWRGRCQVRVGVRPMPADGHSVVGEVPDAPGVFLAATHSGVTLAPVIGELLAENILGGRAPPQIEPFGCHRFQRPG